MLLILIRFLVASNVLARLGVALALWALSNLQNHVKLILRTALRDREGYSIGDVLGIQVSKDEKILPVSICPNYIQRSSKGVTVSATQWQLRRAMQDAQDGVDIF